MHTILFLGLILVVGSVCVCVCVVERRRRYHAVFTQSVYEGYKQRQVYIIHIGLDR